MRRPSPLPEPVEVRTIRTITSTDRGASEVGREQVFAPIVLDPSPESFARRAVPSRRRVEVLDIKASFEDAVVRQEQRIVRRIPEDPVSPWQG